MPGEATRQPEHFSEGKGKIGLQRGRGDTHRGRRGMESTAGEAAGGEHHLDYECVCVRAGHYKHLTA